MILLNKSMFYSIDISEDKEEKNPKYSIFDNTVSGNETYGLHEAMTSNFPWLRQIKEDDESLFEKNNQQNLDLKFISTLVAISLKQDLAKKVPLNYITLIIMTIFVSFMCAFFSLNFSFELVLFCICLTCISAIAITVYIYNSEVNLSIIQAILYVIFGQGGGFLLMWLLLPNPMAEKVTYLVFTLLFGLYLVYDTQVIMKKFGEVYQIDDYILASIFIYMDIINLFLEILSALGKNKKDK